MQLEVFRGKDMRSVVAWVQRSLGEDAMIISTNVLKRADGDVYEVVAAPPNDLEEYRQSLVVGPVSTRIARRGGAEPYVVALVGPPGAGKTTATMKLALHPRGVMTPRVGIVSLDTYRVGGLEEIQTYGEISGLPVEIVYHPREAAPALERLRHVECVVVDTPGRLDHGASWRSVLRELGPDEVHLVMPVSTRIEIAGRMREQLDGVGLTHAFFTKLDEVPGDAGLAALADALELPVRWIGDGHEVPGALAPATSRIVRSLGKQAAPPGRIRQVV